jgi:hypothetical protein
MQNRANWYREKSGWVKATRPACEGFPGSGIGNYCATKSHFPRGPGLEEDAADLFVAGPEPCPTDDAVNQTFFLPVSADVSHRQIYSFALGCHRHMIRGLGRAARPFRLG